MFLIIYLILKSVYYYFNPTTKIWYYWEGPIPYYIEKCHQSLKRIHPDAILLNPDNIYDYLPEMKKYSTYLNNLEIAQKVDIFRIMILYKYGGLYLDSDIYIIKNLNWILDKLYRFDYVGFGATGASNTYGYNFPSNWAMASRPYGILVSLVRKDMIEWINNQKVPDNYHSVGKYLLWSNIYSLNKYGYYYYHVSSHLDGSRDIEGNWINSTFMLSKKQIKYKNPKNISFVVLYNSELKLLDSTVSIKNTNLEKLFNECLLE